MKLATLKDGTRDGLLHVVSKDLTKAIAVEPFPVLKTLQSALDDWEKVHSRLEEIYRNLNEGLTDNAIPFNPIKAASPLPRAYQWADGSAYVNHVELARKSRNAEIPDTFWTDPLMYQGGSDTFLGPCDDISMVSEEWGIDFEAEIAVITDDVPMHISEEGAGKHIKLLMLVNDVSLRGLVPAELAKGFGFFQAKPSGSFSPVAVTPDELGRSWHETKVHLPLVSHVNDQLFGQPNAGVDMTFNFSQLVAHAAKSRSLGAGCIIGSGTVSNIDRSNGSSCLVEKRMLEMLEYGEAKTPFLKFGDTIRIEMFDSNKESIFGAIQQKVVQYQH